ncbi:ArsR/SmtB family transcription factor [Telmatobacter bradus]|uniref:ArsR/SmtB family transcription factor n=1 Tax=Telmatobacter bradus TaxID=474953 RepID=UPI003B43718B
MKRLSATRRTTILKALSDPRRFQLLEQIAKTCKPLSCAQARAVLPIAPATLSHHIKELEAAGLIEVHHEGKYHFLSLKPDAINSLISTLARLKEK